MVAVTTLLLRPKRRSHEFVNLTSDRSGQCRMYVAPQVPCRGNIGVRTSTHLAFLPTKYLLLLWWRCLRRRAHCCSLGRTPSQLAALATVTCWALLHTTSLHIASLSAFSVGAMWRSRRTRIRQQG